MGLPILNLDDKTFEELVKEARALIPRFCREWTDHNVHDPGITFIELFAWLAEMQHYQLNRVTDANYRKFLGLLGLQQYPVLPARMNVALSGVTAVQVLKNGTRLFARTGEEQIVFEAEEDFTLVPLAILSIISSSGTKRLENIQANGKDDIYFDPFGKPASGDMTLELGFDGKLPGVEMQLFFDLYEGDLPAMAANGTIFPSVELTWEYLADSNGGKWSPLTIDKDSTFALTRSGRIVFSWPPDVDENLGCYWVRCRLVEGSYEIPPLINSILLNSVTAVQVQSVHDEFMGTGFPGQAVELLQSFVIPGSLKIALSEDNGDWEEVADFDSSGPADRHYTFDPSAGIIAFGNGLNGTIPGENQTIRASYRITLGGKGNMPSRQQFTIDGFEELVGMNPNPSAGGAVAETLEEAKERAKKELRTTSRAVTAADYQELAVKTPGIRVARAKALPGYHPEYPCIAMPGVVTVVVVPAARRETRCPIPGDGFLRTVTAYLDMHRLVTTDLYVVGPEYVTVAVSCKVHPGIKHDPKAVKIRVCERLEQFLDPFTGGPDKHGWPFGRSVYPSEIYPLLDKTEGVDYATAVVLTAAGYTDNNGIIRIPGNALVVSGELQVDII